MISAVKYILCLDTAYLLNRMEHREGFNLKENEGRGGKRYVRIEAYHLVLQSVEIRLIRELFFIQ